jgi:hypothetical protein
MKKLFLPLLGAALALLLPSCIEQEIEITLNKDGSGTITEKSIFSAQMVGMLEMTAGQPGATNPLADLKDEAKAKAKAKEYGEGVTFVKAEEVKNDKGGKGVLVTYKFTDINKVTFNPSSSMSDMAPQKADVEALGESDNVTFKYADGTLTMTFPEKKEGEAAEAAEEAGEDLPPGMEAQLKQMLKGMKMSAKVTIADGIAESDATYQDGDTITLFEMEMDEILKNPGGFEALGKLEQMGPDDAAEALKKIKGAKGETKDKVTVTIK